jgi:hypothetical protein
MPVHTTPAVRAQGDGRVVALVTVGESLLGWAG